MIVSTIARKALTAALVAAAGAAGSYLFRQYVERRHHGRRGHDDRLDVSRWEGEGGSPPDVTAAVPHQRLGAR